MTHQRPATKPAKIVVVDDEIQVVRFVVDLLGAAGFKAWGATSALEALGKIDEVSPDVVITDMEMPGLDGVELSTVLKSRPRTCKTTVVFLSGRTSDEDYAIAHFSGAAAYIDKPFAPADLIETLGRFIGSESLR